MTGGNGVRDAALSALYAPNTTAEQLAPCRTGFRCADSDRRPSTDGQHRDDCMLSAVSRSRRRARIDALTLAQARTALDFLAGLFANGVDAALAAIAEETTEEALS